MITVAEFINNVSKYSLIREPEYAKLITDFKFYKSLNSSVKVNDKYFALKQIILDIQTFLDKYPDSSKKFDLIDLKKQVFTELVFLYKTYRNNIVNKDAFTVAQVSSFNENLESYFYFWKNLNKDYNFKIYYDSDAHSVKLLKDLLKLKASQEALKFLKDKYQDLYDFHSSTFSNETIKIMYRLKKEFNDFFVSQKKIDTNKNAKEIIKDFLTIRHNYDVNEFTNSMENYKAYFEKMGAIDIRKDSEFYFKNKNLLEIYENELFFNLNNFDSLNILKFNILDKFGGVYIDTSYLPKIKSNVFSDVKVPENLKGLSKDFIEQLKLISIMKNKNYVKGFDSSDLEGLEKYNNDLTEEVRNSLAKSLEKFNLPEEIFVKIGDIKTSELAFLTDIKRNFDVTMIAAHKNSLATNAILEQIETRYKSMHQVYNKINSKNDTYDKARLDLINIIKETNDSEIKNFLLSTRYYLEGDLLEIDYKYNYSKYLNGHEVLKQAIKNILEFVPFSKLTTKEVYNKRLYSLYNLPNVEVTYYSDQAIKLIKSNYNLQNNQYQKVANDLNITINEHFISNKETFDISSLTTLTKDKYRFIYEKGYVNIIYQLQNDDITYNTAKDIFGKYPENSILIQTEVDKKTIYYFNKTNKEVVKQNISEKLPEYLTNFQKMKITFVGHGSINTVSTKSPAELITYMEDSFKDLNNLFNNIKELEISFFSCKNFNLAVNLQETYPAKFLSYIKNSENSLKALVKSNIQNISISTSSYAIARRGGRLNILYFGLFLEKEDAILRGLIPRYIIKYDKDGNITVKPKKVNEAIEKLKLLDNQLTNLEEESNITLLENENLLLDFEDMYLESLNDQDRSVFITEVQEELFKISDFFNLTEEVNKEISTIVKENNLSESYFPLFESIKKVEDKFSITFLNKENGDKKEFFTENESFEKYNRISKEALEDIKQNISKFNEFDIKEIHNVSTLNSAFLIQSLINYTNLKSHMKNMSTAVQVQVYTQLSSISLGILTDFSNLIKIINTATFSPIKVIENLVNKIQFLSFILDAISLGASVYELFETDNKFEKELIESNIGITAINFSLSIASTVAYVTGAITTAEILGVLAVPIAGISIGLPSLVENLLKIQNSAEQLVTFFRQLAKIKEEGYYKLNEEKTALIPSPLAPIKEIDLINNKIKIGDMFISKMVGGSIISHPSENYPVYFSAPYPDNKGEPLNFSNVILSDINQGDLSHNTIVLPSALNVRYKTEHKFVIGSARWWGDGEKALDKIRYHYGGTNFHWRFYSAGGEQMLTNLSPEYKNTNTIIICDNQNRNFISPLVQDKEIIEKLYYTIKYQNNLNYTYTFQKSNIKLDIEPLNKEEKNYSKWIFRIDNLTYNSDDNKKIDKINSILRIYNNKDEYYINFGSQNVNIFGYTNEEVYLTFKDYNENINDDGINFFVKLDLPNKKIGQVIVSCNIKDNILGKVDLFSYIEQLDLPKELLKDIILDINSNFDLTKATEQIKGRLNLLKDEYILNVEKQDEQNKTSYFVVIKDKTFNELNTKFCLKNKDSTIIKKYSEKLNKNLYFLKGEVDFIVNNEQNANLNQIGKNQFILEIVDTKSIVIKNMKLGSFIFKQVLYALNELDNSLILYNRNIDLSNDDRKSRIVFEINKYLQENILKDYILLCENSVNKTLEYKLDDNLIISGKDELNRNLNFIFNNNTYCLTLSEWEQKIENIKSINCFTYNLLGKNELILTKKQDKFLNDYILLTEDCVKYIDKYVKSLVIQCDFNINKIFFKNFEKSAETNLKVIDILITDSLNSEPLNIYLPFNKHELTWNVEGSNFIINAKNKKINLLDIFSNNINKEIIIFISCNNLKYDEVNDKFNLEYKEKLSLNKFMKEFKQLS